MTAETLTSGPQQSDQSLDLSDVTARCKIKCEGFRTKKELEGQINICYYFALCHISILSYFISF